MTRVMNRVMLRSGGGSSLVALAAGGTGGHVIPAVALAREIVRRGRDVLMLSDARGERFLADDLPRRILPSSPLSPRRLLADGARCLKALLAARRVLRETNPVLVVGFGGYPSLAPCLCAAAKRIPLAVHEQNARLGRANRLLARRADVVALSFPNAPSEQGLPTRARRVAQVTGLPLRDEAIDAAESPYRTPRPDAPFELLVVGGSQGAVRVVRLVADALERLAPSLRARLRLVMQCPPQEKDAIEKRLVGVGVGVGVSAEIAEFFPDLPRRMARAHLAVSRAGASTLAELSAVGRPAFLAPLPEGGGEQRLNASIAARSDAFRVAPDDPEDAAQALAEFVAELAENPDLAERLAQSARRDPVGRSPSRLADAVLRPLGDATS